MKHETKADAKFSAGAIAGAGLNQVIGLHNHWEVECYDKDGNLKWVDEIHNLVVTEGLNDAIDKHFKAAAYTAAWVVGLADGTPTPAAGDTMASHAGWAEVTAYTEANRPALTLGAVSGGAANNSASKATFSINANGTTIGGAFLTTNNTKGGTTGILYGVGAFSAGDKLLDNGDTLNVTVTVSAAAV